MTEKEQTAREAELARREAALAAREAQLEQEQAKLEAARAEAPEGRKTFLNNNDPDFVNPKEKLYDKFPLTVHQMDIIIGVLFALILLFLALGMLGAWVSCFLTGYAGPSAIFQSMLFAYTWLWPDQMVLLFGIIPFKMKYLGWIELAFWAFSFLTGSFAIKVSLVLGLAGFLAFYGREVFDWCVDAVKDWKRRRDWENRNR